MLKTILNSPIIWEVFCLGNLFRNQKRSQNLFLFENQCKKELKMVIPPHLIFLTTLSLLVVQATIRKLETNFKVLLTEKSVKVYIKNNQN